MRRWLRSTALVIAIALSSGKALAAIDPNLICNDGAVDKERLAILALSKAQVSFYPLYWAGRNGDPFGQLPPAVRVLAISRFCDLPTGAAGPPVCDKGDADKLAQARNYFDELLSDTRFGNPTGVEAAAYLRSTNIRITCPSAAVIAAAAAEAPTPIKQPDISKATLRVRGSTDGLQFRRGSSQFAGLDKATVTFGDDRKDAKKTFQVTAIIGLTVPVSTGFEAVPYFGYSIDKSTKKDDPATPANETVETVNKDTLRTGLLLNYRMVTDGGTHYFLFRPEYAANRKERSEVVSANFAYVPVLDWLNDYALSIRGSNQLPLFSIMPRGELRGTYGHFGKAGTRLAVESVDFLRVGGQIGATLSSDIDWLPIDLTVTESYLYGLSGNPEDLSQLKFVLSASFDAKKYFGVDIGYTRGRAEDLLERSNKWTIGFGAKF